MDIDASDFERLASDLGAEARADLVEELRPVVSKAALNVKQGASADLRGSRSFRVAASSVTYDLTARREYVEAEVGPVTGPGGVPGDLAHFAYFGGANGGGGTVRDPEVHLEAEAPNLEEYAGKVLDDLLGRLS